VGTWRGSGSGRLHDHEPFDYEEEDRLYSFISLTAGSDFSQGKLDGTNVSLTAASAPMADGVETVEVLRRDYRVDGDRMTYEVRMASAGTPTELHIAGELRRGPS
jgi:hypothetical protein